MVLQITQIWIEERDKILAYCMKKTSKTKKHLQKKISSTAPSAQLAVMKLFIKRCALKFQVRFMTWQHNYSMKGQPEEKLNKIKEQINDKITNQESIELDLFKDVYVPYMRDKDKKKDKEDKQSKVIVCANLKEIQEMF